MSKQSEAFNSSKWSTYFNGLRLIWQYIFTVYFVQCHDTQHDDFQPNDIERNKIQHYNIQYNDTQHGLSS
jgi:hypothetical protein